MSHSLSKLNIHLIFSTKGRQTLISNSVREALHAYCATVILGTGCSVVALNSVEDHMHILLDLGRSTVVSKVIEQVKSASSRWIKTQGDEYSDFAWQAGYAAFGVDASNVEIVRLYILNQREHHQTESFQDEYRRFLTTNSISFNEQYLWD